MQEKDTHILHPPSKRGGWGKKKRYDVTLTVDAVTQAKAARGNFSGLMDELLTKWVKGRKP